MTTRAIVPACLISSTNNFYESATISKETLRSVQDREAQERAARDLQESATQATPGLTTI